MDSTSLLTTYCPRRSSAHHVDVEMKQVVLKGDAAVDVGRSSVNSTEDVGARVCTVIPQSYPGSTCRAACPRRGEPAGASEALTPVVEEEGDRRAGRVAVESLVRDRLAFPCFLLCLSLRGLRLAACACALHGPMMPAVFTRSRDQCALL